MLVRTNTEIDLHKFPIIDDGSSGSFPFNEVPQIIMENVPFKFFLPSSMKKN